MQLKHDCVSTSNSDIAPSCRQQHLLTKTAVATISASSTCMEANTLFDEGSQCSVVTKSLENCLQLQTHGTEELSISTFGAHTSQIRTSLYYNT